MNRKLTLSIILLLCAQVYCKISFGNLITINGPNSTNYNLGTNDTLFIASGTYSGNINGFSSQATIIIGGSATFSPGSMPNNSAGTMYVYGQFTMSSNLTTNSEFVINNYGIVTLSGTLDLKGASQTWNNYTGGLMIFGGNVTFSASAAVFNNYETMNFNANFNQTTGAINNFKDFFVFGTYQIKGGTLNNSGNFETKGLLDFNNGAAIIHNYCRMISHGGISNSSNNFYNHSYLWAMNDLGLGDITNSGTIYNVPAYFSEMSKPMIHGRNFTVTSGSVIGNAYLYFYGTTSTTGGTTGVAVSTNDTIRMYDITRATPTSIYDIKSGAAVVNPNVIYNAWGVPDSTRVYEAGCSLEIMLDIPLAIDWKSFFVTLSDNTPVLSWTAEFDPGTVFKIQRSYDGTHFSDIGTEVSSIDRSEYSYSDKLVNRDRGTVYYRIKGIELNNHIEYTQVRTVKFSSKPVTTIHIAPNPFTSNFIINYPATGKETLTVRLFNMSGQQQYAKNVTVDSGMNRIDVNEAGNLAKGIYLIQVSRGYEIVSSGKIVKQ